MIELRNGKKITNYRLRKWSKMTNYNEHTFVRIELSSFFEETKEGKELNEFCNKLILHNGITFDEALKRNKLTNNLLDYIKVNYGEDAYKQIVKTL